VSFERPGLRGRAERSKRPGTPGRKCFERLASRAVAKNVSHQGQLRKVGERRHASTCSREWPLKVEAVQGAAVF